MMRPVLWVLAALAAIQCSLPTARASVVLDHTNFDTSHALLLPGPGTPGSPEVFAIDPGVSGVLANITFLFPPNSDDVPVTVAFSTDGNTFFGSVTETSDESTLAFVPSTTVVVTSGNSLFVEVAADDADGAAFYAGLPSAFTSYVSGPLSGGGIGFSDFVDTSPVNTGIPEPASLALLAGGLIGLGAVRRQRGHVPTPVR
jgi:hypothetical protein